MAMPMKEEDGVQEIYTRDHGTIRVKEKSWQDGGHHIVLNPQGVYQHMSGLPIKDEAEIFAAFGENNEDAKQRCLNWFRNRHEQLENPPRPITFRSDNTPVFEDGSIPEESDLYSFFSPGPVLSAAIVGLHLYRQRKESGEKPQELRKVTPAQEPGQAAPAPSPEKYSPRARGEAKAKAKRAAARAAKAKAVKTTQPAQVATQG